ncbi:Uncharacterised protein [Candidatus Gugararchaeum adminiculabundum]|nr:Uncharacterised protein [Candidatus Gugararchaeum adminiculabundum]
MDKRKIVLVFTLAVIGILLLGCCGIGGNGNTTNATKKGALATCSGSGADRCKTDTIREYDAKCVSKKWVYKNETCANGCENGECLSNPSCNGLDDSNACTQDVCDATTNYTIAHKPLNGTQGTCTGNAGTCAVNSCVSGTCQKVTTDNCCGNNKCDASETTATCPGDCKGIQSLTTEEIGELKTLVSQFEATRSISNEDACKALIGSSGGCIDDECATNCEANTNCNGATNDPASGGALLMSAVVQFGTNVTQLDIDYDAVNSRLDNWAAGGSTQSNLDNLKTRLTRMVSAAGVVKNTKLKFIDYSSCYDRTSNPMGDYCFCSASFSSINPTKLNTALAKVDIYLNRTG